MITRAKLARDLRKAGALHELLAPCAFHGDTVLTKRGDVFQVLRLSGIDPECLEPATIGSITHRFDAALRILNPEYRVYQYVFKHAAPPLPVPDSTDSLALTRAEWLETRRPHLYGIDLFLVVLRTRPLEDSTARSFLSRLSARQSLTVARSELRRDADQLATVVHSLTVQLQDTVRPQLLDRAGTLHFLRRLVNYTPWKAEVHGSVQDFHLDQQMAVSGIECWPRYLKQDEHHVKVLSLIEPPAQTFPNLLRGLLAVPCNMVIASEWKREPNHVVRREIDKKRRHYHIAKTSFLGSLGNSNPRPDEVLVDDSKTAMVEVLGLALREIEVNENFFGSYSLTFSLYHEHEPTLRHAVAKVTEVLATHDARLVEEHYNMLNAWMAMVPGNYLYNFRPMWLLNTNYADLSFQFAPSEGNRVNPHLNAPALGIVETRDATPYFMNLHHEDVGHSFVLGAIGAGKSFLVNFGVSGYQQYRPFTVIFDIGGSYRKLTTHYGGSYLHVGKESTFTINPFSLPPTKENLGFLFSFVRVLVEHNGEPMTPDERKDLDRAINDLYLLDPGARTLQTLAQTCRRSYSVRLAEWVGQGRLARYFDHVEDNLTLARFQTFDFEGMDQPEVVEPVLFYILHRANATIYDPALQGTPKLVVFDEAWKFFRNPITAAYIQEALKTWRKRNGVMILATQSGDDLQRSAMLPVIAESCMTRMFLANPGMDAAVYREAFQLNQTETEQIARLIPKRQFLLKQPGTAKVLNLFVDAHALRVFGNQGPTQ